MAEITAALVKELRDKTNAGMMECKNALKETSGDVDAAIKFLRERGAIKAAKKADREVASKVSVFFPNQRDRGSHINVSGGGVTSSSKNKDEAIQFLEFLSNSESQEIFGKVNYEYPVKIEKNKSGLLRSWGRFKADKVSLSLLGKKNSEAVKLFDLAGWE